MKSLFDLFSLILFAGIAVLFLHRSTQPEADPVALWRYGVAAIGCAVADYLGNHGQTIGAVILFIAVILFSVFMLNVLPKSNSR